MKRTSPIVLAWLFATCQAIKLTGDGTSDVGGYKDVSNEAEKVHVLDLGMNTMSNGPKGTAAPETVGEFAFPNIRTAYYAQTGRNDNRRENEDTPYKKDHMNGSDVLDMTMGASEGIPDNRDKSIEPRSFVQTEKKTKADPLSPENMDPWVYKYTKENIDPYTQWHMEDNIDQTMKEKWNGMAQMKRPHHHHKKDIGERGYDEEVQQFVKEYIPPLNTRVRSTLPFMPNGSNPKAFDGTDKTGFHQKKHHKKHHKRDIGERGYDEEVQQFVKEYIPPLNTRVRSTLPFVPNGSDAKAFDGTDKTGFTQKHHHKKHHYKPDVAERGMNEEVNGFVDDNTSPVNIIEHAYSAPAMNGGKTKSFAQPNRNYDVAERGMNEEVNGFVDDNTSPVNIIEHAHSAPAMNGGKTKSLVQQKMKAKAKDIADRGIDEEVWGFVSPLVTGINAQDRYDEPFIPNGSQTDWNWLSQRRHHHKHHKRPDVAERNMDEEVHGFVADSLPPLTEWEHTKQPFIPNGSDASAFEGTAFHQKNHHNKHHKKHHKRDIGERGYDEEVQQFVKEYIPPLNTMVRSPLPFVPNGSDPSAHEQTPYENSFGQRRHHHHQPRNSLAQAQYGGDVIFDNWHHTEHGQTTDDWAYNTNAVSALSDRPRRLETAPYLNGYANVYDSFAQQPYPTNGGSNVYAQVAHGNGDIANKEVRPDVYVTVHKMINPVAMGRHTEPRPSAPPSDRTWDQGPKPKPPPEPEFKFVKPEEPDEDVLKAKKEKAAKANKAKAKKEKEAKDEEDAKPDEEAAGVVPEKKEVKPPTEEEEKTAELDKKEAEKAAEEAEKKEKEEDEAKAKLAKEAEKVNGKPKKSEEAAQTPAPAAEETAPAEAAPAAKEEAAPAAKEEAAPAAKEAAPAAPEAAAALSQKKILAQKKADGDKKAEKKDGEPVPAPEKVHILEPHEYKEKADTNTPNIRTTFYGKKEVKKAQI